MIKAGLNLNRYQKKVPTPRTLKLFPFDEYNVVLIHFTHYCTSAFMFLLVDKARLALSTKRK